MPIKKLSIIIAFLLFVGAILIGISSQATDGNIVSAVLQYHVDLANPPTSIVAISIADQALPNGSKYLKGTKFIGKLEKSGESDIKISFDMIQLPTGNQENFKGETNFNSQGENYIAGVSSKVGETLNSSTKSTVLGAIFGHSGANKRPIGNVLPRGTNLSIGVK